MRFDYDVIIVGAGHAGCEAAMASAKIGAETLLVTADMNRIAQMSCNPAIGGVAKGQIVREIDALGGMTGIIADKTAIQFRMLNRSKGPAMWSPRVQSDRTKFIDAWRQALDAQPRLSIYQDMVASLIIDSDAEASDSEAERPVVKGVRTALGLEFTARKVVLCAGTFLDGLMHFGGTQIAGGRISEEASLGVGAQLTALGIRTDRMKTGTPMRIDGSTIDFSLVEAQTGDDLPVPDFHKFSFLPESKRSLRQRECYIVHTNPETHKVLNAHLDESPMYNGQIQSIGPRYCPSIETKIVTFADKQSHQLFLEPEGETTTEFYVNGFSSSMPWQVQFEAIKTIPALRNVHIYRPGYAIEYDFFDPTQLRHTLESRVVDGLYLAGQVNGTTGYEEAAGQGLVAGANAALAVQGKESLVLRRDEAYLGVLIDDLVNKGVDEPYRMFTSRAEYRILLRQDDADMRLTPIGHAIGLADDRRYQLMLQKREGRDRLIEWCEAHNLKCTDENNSKLEALGTSPMASSTKVSDLLKRPQLDLQKLASVMPDLSKQIAKIREEFENAEEILESAEILIKYDGYIRRERENADKRLRLEYVKLPEDMDYESISSLSTEARQKLAAQRPATIGAASRIPGVSPADIQVLLVLLNR